jgi:hypothetical protein
MASLRMSSRVPQSAQVEMMVQASEVEQKMKNSYPDHFYHNAIISNNSDAAIPAQYIETRTTDMLQNAEDWYLSIIRFRVPTDNIPLFLFQQTRQQLTATASLASNILTAIAPGLSATIPIGAEVGGAFIPANTFVTDNTVDTQLTISNAATGNNTGTYQFVSSPYELILQYGVTQFPAILRPIVALGGLSFNPYGNMPLSVFVQDPQGFLNSVNDAFARAFADLKAAFPAFPGTVPPYVYLDPASGLLHLVAQQNAWQQQFPAGGAIYFNLELQRFFQGLPSLNIQPISLSTLFQMIIQATGEPGNFIVAVPPDPNGNSGYSAYDMVQDSSSMFYWSSFTKLLIISGTLPIQYEYIPAIAAGQGPGTSGSAQITSGSNFQAIVTDYDVLNSTNYLDRSPALFTNPGPYRLISMSGTGPLKKLDYTVYWQDRSLNNFPVLISPNDFVEIKTMFRKKFLQV